MRSVLAPLAFFITAIAAQNYTLPAGFNPGLVSSGDKANWCLGERNTCPIICGGAASSNDCDPGSLTFTCVCSNGTVPNVAAYQGTLPFYVCESNFAQCMDNNPTNQTGQDQCKSNANCGTLNASALTTSATASASVTSLLTSTGTAPTASATSAAAAAASSKAAAVALHTVQEHSISLLVAALLAAFRLLL